MSLKFNVIAKKCWTFSRSFPNPFSHFSFRFFLTFPPSSFYAKLCGKYLRNNGGRLPRVMIVVRWTKTTFRANSRALTYELSCVNFPIILTLNSLVRIVQTIQAVVAKTAIYCRDNISHCCPECDELRECAKRLGAQTTWNSLCDSADIKSTDDHEINFIFGKSRFILTIKCKPMLALLFSKISRGK